MDVYIRDVEPSANRRGWWVFWAFDRASRKSDGRCFTPDKHKAALCAEARHHGQRVTVELNTTHGPFPRLMAVALTEAA